MNLNLKQVFAPILREQALPSASVGIRSGARWQTLLIDYDAPVKVTQEVMRHANSRVTLELYQQVNMKAKQALQARVVSEW